MSLGIVTYQSKAVYITSGDYLSDQTVVGSIKQLDRIQNLSWFINYGLKNESYIDVGNETITASRPTIMCNLEFKTTDGYNEYYMGFNTLGGSGLFSKLNEQKNIYIVSEETEGYDAIGGATSGQKYVIGLGQAVVNSYSLSVQVGGVMSSNITFEALHAATYTGTQGQPIPSVDPVTGDQLSGVYFNIPPATSGLNIVDNGINHNVVADRYSDILVTFPATSQFGSTLGGEMSCNAQSIRMDFVFNRQSLKSMGSVFPADRPIIYPVNVNISADLYLTELQADELNNFGCMTTTGQSMNIRANVGCGDDSIPLEFDMVGLQLVDQSSSLGIGNGEISTFNWNLTINSPFDSNNNIFFRSMNAIKVLEFLSSGVLYTGVDQNMIPFRVF